MAEAGEYPTGLFGCCSVKDCGVGCCVKSYCCVTCNYGSAIETAELGSCMPCCFGIYLFGPCVGTYNRVKLAEKYNINEPVIGAFGKYCCCLPCAIVQDINLVLVKENKTWGCGKVVGGAPANAEEMAR